MTRRKPSDVDALDAVSPVASVRRAAAEGGVNVATRRVSLPVGAGDPTLCRDRHERGVRDGVRTGLWRVEALRPLFRGERQPSPDAVMAHSPKEDILFFAVLCHEGLAVVHTW